MHGVIIGKWKVFGWRYERVWMPCALNYANALRPFFIFNLEQSRRDKGEWQLERHPSGSERWVQLHMLIFSARKKGEHSMLPAERHTHTHRQVRLKNEMDWWVDRRIMIQSESGVRRVFLLYLTKAGRMHWREQEIECIFKHLFFSLCCSSCVCVCARISGAIVSLSLWAYVRACHSLYVKAVCTFALLRSSPEVVL